MKLARLTLRNKTVVTPLKQYFFFVAKKKIYLYKVLFLLFIVGTAERTNRTLLNHARCMLISSGLPHKFWAEAVAYSVFIRNRCLSKSNPVTAYESWFQRKPDVSGIRIFGVEAFALDPMAGKLDPQSKQGVFIGICETQKAYRIFLPETQKIIVCRHVRFNENVFYKDMILAPAQKVKFV